MEIEIICWKTKDKIKICNSDGIFEEVNNSCDKTYFYHIHKNTYKIVYTDINEKKLYENYLSNNKEKIIIVNEVNKDNVLTVKRMIKDTIIIAGTINVEDKDCGIEDKVVLFPQLFYGMETIDIKAIMLILNSNCNLLGSTIIIGCKHENDALGNIPLTILKNFNFVQNYKRYDLYLFSSNELGLQELTYIEDPLREYISYDSMLKINQLGNNEISSEIYFLFLSKKG